MGVVLFLIVLFVVWWLWPRDKSSRPAPGGTETPFSQTSALVPVEGRSSRQRSRHWRNLNQSGNARGPDCIAITYDQFRLELPVVSNHRTVCAICEQEKDILFCTSRITLCKDCEESLRESCGGPIGYIQGKIFWFLHLEWPHEPPLKRFDLALNKDLGEDDKHRSRDADLDMQMADSGLEEWRIWLRAYHLGLTATWPPEFRPDDDEWKPLAHRIRVEDGMCCVVCYDNNTALHVHHIIPLSEGGTNEPINLVTLCGSCHRAQHQPGLFSRPMPADT